MVRASKRARDGWCRVLARALCAVAPAMAQGEVTAKRNRFVAKTAENGAWPTRGGCKGRPGGGPRRARPGAPRLTACCGGAARRAGPCLCTWARAGASRCTGRARSYHATRRGTLDSPPRGVRDTPEARRERGATLQVPTAPHLDWVGLGTHRQPGTWLRVAIWGCAYGPLHGARSRCPLAQPVAIFVLPMGGKPSRLYRND